MKTNFFRLATALFCFAALDAFAAPIITANKDDNLAAGLRKFPGNINPPFKQATFPRSRTETIRSQMLPV